MPVALVTCGPAHEPIDAVRRITNHATGEVGTLLSTVLHEAGFKVVCLRGESASYPPPTTAEVIPFSTNKSLAAALEDLPTAPVVIFHAAALADFCLSSISGLTPNEGKIRSDVSELVLTLRPAEKILPSFRALFPEALIVGWKYEVDGEQADCLSLARSQITRARTDACVANGPAYGPGFGLVEAGIESVSHLPDKAGLARHLVDWTRKKLITAP